MVRESLIRAGVLRPASGPRAKLGAPRSRPEAGAAVLDALLAERDEGAKEVIARVHKPGKVALDPLRGHFSANIDGIILNTADLPHKIHYALLSGKLIFAQQPVLH